MNLTEFRQRVKELHPDLNGGDHSRTAELQALVAERDSLCKCGCGRVRPVGRDKYYSHVCYMRAKYPARTMAALASVVVLAVLSASAQPTLPQAVIAPPQTVDIHLSWGGVVGATAYRILYGTNGTTWDQTTTVTETTLTLPVLAGPTYYFKVRAQAGLDESDDSNIAMLNTAPGPYLNHWTPVIAMSWATPAGQTSILQFSTKEGEWSDVLETTNAITATTQALVGVQGKWRTRYK